MVTRRSVYGIPKKPGKYVAQFRPSGQREEVYKGTMPGSFGKKHIPRHETVNNEDIPVSLSKTQIPEQRGCIDADNITSLTPSTA
jgi:hypothetical protein